ncbi:MAG: hypothetical protein ACLGID_14435 [Gammaproteobacteria bacterium]
MPFKSIADLLGAQAKVGGVPTYELADSGRNDLETMLQCCDAEEVNYLQQPFGDRLAPAPAYFLRVAILSRKAHDYAGEIAICNRWFALAKDYHSQPSVKAGRGCRINRGPGHDDMKKRLPKAKELLRKQKAAKKA